MQSVRVLTAGLCLAYFSAQVYAAPTIGSSRAAPSIIASVAMAANAPVKIGSLVIDALWARATPPGTTVAGGFLRITNEGSEPDRLLGGQAAFADHVEIHETSMVDDVMRMRQLTEGLEIKPGQTVEFKPGSYHVMFVGVKEPLKQGSRAKATLDFEKAGKVEVEFDVVGVGAGAPQGVHMH
ncbi:MAG: copper chaperone PCu(A)C [Beijerinckiaceae bacterium]